MRANIGVLCGFLLALGMSTPTQALDPGQRVDNFRLLDHRGVSHELYYLSDAKAVVLMVQGSGCPIVRKALPALKALREQYGGRGVEFLLLNSNLQDTREDIAREATAFDIDFAVLKDETQLIGESLGIERTADVFVIDPKTWKLVYRGPIDDRLSYGAQKPAATRNYLADALDDVLSGSPVRVAKADAPGCLVNLPEQEQRAAHAKISYSETIAPLLEKRCASCHRPGGVAPWAMTGYDLVRGFAPMMREVVRTQRMPPWHADPHFGAFEGDRSLSAEEARTLVHWIEAGAPRGDGPDPLAKLGPSPSEWTLGTPDLIVQVPAYNVPESGVVNYQYPRVANPLDHDVWVRAVEVLPGDRSVVHHVLAGLDDPVDRGKRTAVEQLAQFGGYAPGKNALVYPPETGVLLRKEASLRFQMHYTPSGKATTDVTRVGYYFAARPPRSPLRLVMLANYSLVVPPNTKAHTETVEHVFERDVVLHSLMPHAHLRGKASKFTARYPDGTQEVLLSVPKYDFNWQTHYLLKQPKRLPAGTKVIFDMTWDNSAQNPANPDPNRAVPWGEQTWDEMNAGWIRYRFADDGAEANAMLLPAAPAGTHEGPLEAAQSR
jgi:mono/diheme cytochrome c family protein